MASTRPTETQAGLEALRTSIGNRFNRYRFEKNDATTAGWRFHQGGFLDVQFTPKFKLGRDEAIFTMGSCFARNVEESMMRAGLNVLLRDFDFPQHLLHPNHNELQAALNGPEHGRWIRTVLNKYNTHSMLNEFERILAPERFRDPFRGLIQVDEHRWFDPQIKNLRNTSLMDALLGRDVVESAAALVIEASVVFLTLGLTETWLDAETNVLMNLAPAPTLIRRFPERFRFFNATHAQVVQCLEDIRTLLMAKGRRALKFVVTVSPVPLHTTFTKHDVITANGYSKATLRSAAGEFAYRHDNVDYFPSYEMVVLTRPELVWEEDCIHIQQPLIDSVISRFAEGYLERPVSAAAAG